MVTYQLNKYIVTHTYVYIYIIRTYKICNYKLMGIHQQKPWKRWISCDLTWGVFTWGDSDGSQGDSP